MAITHGKLDPRRCGVALDSMVLDRDGTPRDELVDRLLALEQDGAIHFLQPGTAYRQMDHPRTPGYVRDAMRGQIFSLPTELTPVERERRRRVLQIMRGNAVTGRHDADAAILFEAGKYGCGYVITEDKRILSNRTELQKTLGPPLRIVTLAEFLTVYDAFVVEERKREKLLSTLRK